MTDAVGTTGFGYNGGGSLASEDGPWSSDTVSLYYADRSRTNLTLLQPTGTWTNRFTWDAALRLATVSSPAGTFTSSHRFLLRQYRQQGNDDFTKQPGTIDVLLRETFPLNTVARQPPKVLQSVCRTFPAEAIQRPKEHHVETLLVRILEQMLEVSPICGTPRLLIGVLLADRPARLGCHKAAKLEKLVLHVLAFVFG